MEEKKAKTSEATKTQLEEKTTYRIGDRSFVVEPIFKIDGQNTLGSVLLRLMKYESIEA